MQEIILQWKDNIWNLEFFIHFMDITTHIKQLFEQWLVEGLLTEILPRPHWHYLSEPVAYSYPTWSKRIVHPGAQLLHGAVFSGLQGCRCVLQVQTTVRCSGPREDATRIGSAGVIRRQAVDISPLRRVNQAIYLITTGAREASFRNVKTIAECLADELVNAAKGSSNR